MMSAQKGINQLFLTQQLAVFLEALSQGREESEKESIPAWAYEGLCNAFNFMRWRADMGGQASQYFKRLDTLAQADDNTVRSWGKLYQDYQDIYKMIASKNINQQDIERNVLTELQEKYQDIQPEQLEQNLAFVKDLYLFIHSLLASHTIHANLGIEQGQMAYSWIMNNILSINTVKEKLSEKESESFGFVPYTKETLKEMLNALDPGDSVLMNTGKHVFNKKKKGEESYKVYETLDLGMITAADFEEQQRSSDEVVVQIQTIYFDNREPMLLQVVPLERPDRAEVKRVDLIEILKNKIQKGWDVNTPSTLVGGFGETALILTVLSYPADYTMIKWLLDQGADINQADSNGFTPLIHAIRMQDSTLVNFILSKGAKINTLTLAGETPLMFAAQGTEAGIVRTLVERYKDNINAIDENGATAAHWAAFMGNVTALQALIENGADMTLLTHPVQDMPSQTPLDLAINQKHWDCVLFLLMKLPQDNISQENLAILNDAEIKNQLRKEFKIYLKTLPKSDQLHVKSAGTLFAYKRGEQPMPEKLSALLEGLLEPDELERLKRSKK